MINWSDFRLGMFAGAVLGVVACIAPLATHPIMAESIIVAHQCAHYDQKTGAFTWDEKVKP